MMTKKITVAVLLGVFLFASGGEALAAAYPVDVWIPYWKKEAGIAEATPNLNPIWRVHPFAYEVQPDGTLVDTWKMDEIATDDFFLDVRAAKAKIVPTVAWHNGSEIMNVLSSSTSRAEHISVIMAHVTEYKFDGVDINYEGKPAESNKYFTLFLKELSTKLKAKKKILSCTIEPRTPLTSRFSVIPKDIEYANDYKAINKYCDEVNIMAYDQRNIDILLNAKKGKSGYYMPVADKEWVEKVIKETVKTISAKKIRLGVATFGYEYEISSVTPINGTSTISSSTPPAGGWEIMPEPSGGIVVGNTRYEKLRSLTYKDFQAIQLGFDGMRVRNNAGEFSATYRVGGSQRYAVVSDSVAVAQKVALAKKYGLKGVAVWSVNGENDPNLWKSLK